MNTIAREKLSLLRRHLAGLLPQLLAGLEEACTAFWTSPWDAPRYQEAYGRVHSLVGTVGTYGFVDLYRMAFRLQDLILATEGNRAHLGAELQCEAEDLLRRMKVLAGEIYAAGGV